MRRIIITSGPAKLRIPAFIGFIGVFRSRLGHFPCLSALAGAHSVRNRHYSWRYSWRSRADRTAQTSLGKSRSRVQSNATRTFLSKPGNLLR